MGLRTSATSQILGQQWVAVEKELRANSDEFHGDAVMLERVVHRLPKGEG